MGYSDDPEMVRVDFYRNDAIYNICAVRWTGDYEGLLSEEYAVTLVNYLAGKPALLDCTAVCAEPYHCEARPVMLTAAQALDLVERRNGRLAKR